MAVVWITGLAGSGKSTLAKTVAATLRRQGREVQIVDGDVFRKTHVPQLGYSRQERLRCALAITRFAGIQARDNDITLVATISLFHDVHALNRELHASYLEVLLEVTPPILAQRQRERRENGQGPWVGREIEPEFPKAPHLRLNNDLPADLARNSARLTTAINDIGHE